MKKKYWIFIIGIINFVILLATVILVLALKINWWLFFGFLIPTFIGWLIFGVISLINLDKKDKKEQIELDDALKMVVEYSVKHPHNPDNFKYEKHSYTQVGEPGAEMTEILTIIGTGTEKGQDRFFVIKTEEQNKFSLLIDADQKELNDTIIKMAKSQPRPVITEQIPGTDNYGRPTTKYITKTTSRAEIKQKEDEEKAKEDLGV